MILSSRTLIPLLLLSACTKTEPIDTSSIYPPGLAPLSDCEAEAPSATETDPTPELLNVLSDAEADPMWAHGHGYVHAPIALVWEALRDDRVLVNRRKVAEWTVTPDADPAFDYGFTINNVVYDIITVTFDMHYDQGVILGTLAAPEHVAVRRAIVDPDIILKVMEGSMLLTAVSEDVTEIEIVEHLDSVEGEIEPTVEAIQDLYACLLAYVHDEPMPEYN